MSRVDAVTTLMCLNCYSEDIDTSWTADGTYELCGDGTVDGFQPDVEDEATCPRCGSDDWVDL